LHTARHAADENETALQLDWPPSHVKRAAVAGCRGRLKAVASHSLFEHDKPNNQCPKSSLSTATTNNEAVQEGQSSLAQHRRTTTNSNAVTTVSCVRCFLFKLPPLSLKDAGESPCSVALLLCVQQTIQAAAHGSTRKTAEKKKKCVLPCLLI
jgi:hypothetical protein